MARNKRLDDFTQGYLEAALFSSTDDEDEPLDQNYDFTDFAPEALKEAVDDTTRFQEENAEDLEEAAELMKPSEWTADERNGHDFWFTRNGHGVGFWDRGYGDVGERLSEAARDFGELWLYVGDDGQLYFSH